ATPEVLVVVLTVNSVSAEVALWIWKAAEPLVAAANVAVPLAINALLLATVVAPLSATPPVPVAKLPVELDWSKLPFPAAKVKLLLAASCVEEPNEIPEAPELMVVIPVWELLPMVIAEAFPVPIDTVPVVPVEVPTSMATLPEAKAPEVTLPEVNEMLLVAAPLLLVVVTFTPPSP